MVVAVLVAVGVMLLAADPLANFIARNPTVVMLALGFLLMIGAVLIADGFGVHVPKGYIYAAMAFSALVEGLNMFARRARARKQAAAGGRGRARPLSVQAASAYAKLMTVHFHEEDLPEGVLGPGPGRRRHRDDGAAARPRPALPGADLRRPRRRASRPLRRRQRLCRAQPQGGARRSGAAQALPFRPLRPRLDPRLSRGDGGAGLLHQDRLAPDPHLYRPARPQGSGQGGARPGNLQAAAKLRLGRARAQRRAEGLCRRPTCAICTR